MKHVQNIERELAERRYHKFIGKAMLTTTLAFVCGALLVYALLPAICHL